MDTLTEPQIEKVEKVEAPKVTIATRAGGEMNIKLKDFDELNLKDPVGREYFELLLEETIDPQLNPVLKNKGLSRYQDMEGDQRQKWTDFLIERFRDHKEGPFDTDKEKRAARAAENVKGRLHKKLRTSGFKDTFGSHT